MPASFAYLRSLPFFPEIRAFAEEAPWGARQTMPSTLTAKDREDVRSCCKHFGVFFKVVPDPATQHKVIEIFKPVPEEKTGETVDEHFEQLAGVLEKLFPDSAAKRRGAMEHIRKLHEGSAEPPEKRARTDDGE